jgi:hypothetical protein
MELDVQLDPQHLERLTAATPLTGVTELIWNALDADAEKVEVTLVRNDLHGSEPQESESAETAEVVNLEAQRSRRK